MTRYTLVRHSGYGYGRNPSFAFGVEPRSVNGNEAKSVRAAGGLLFDSYREADERAEAEMYYGAPDSLLPRVRGSFSEVRFGGLQVYVPLEG